MRGETATRRSGRRSRGGRRPPSPRAAARSRATSRAIGPAWSSVGASGTMPRIETRPRVGLIVDVPHMRRDPQRARGVGPGRRGRLRARERRAGAAARPAGRAIELPRVADLVGRAAAANSCVCRWPSSTIPSRLEPRPRVAVALRDLVEDAARRRQRLARHGVEVLQPDRHAAERRRAARREAPRRRHGRRRAARPPA